MPKAHTYRIKSDQWEAIQAKAWQLSKEANRIIKPTDVVHAILFKGIKDLRVEDVALAEKARKGESQKWDKSAVSLCTALIKNRSPLGQAPGDGPRGPPESVSDVGACQSVPNRSGSKKPQERAISGVLEGIQAPVNRFGPV